MTATVGSALSIYFLYVQPTETITESCLSGVPDCNAFHSEITAEKLSQGASSAGHSVTAMSTLTPTPYELTFFGSRDGAQTYL